MKRKITIGIALLLALGSVWVYCIDFPGRGFDPTLWKADPSVRQDMAERLVARGSLMRLTRTEVRGLLGIPDRVDESDGSFKYILGAERGMFSMDVESLVIHFAADGCVVSSRVTTN